MKNKKLSKKLTLKKHTVTNLDNNQLGIIQAGVIRSYDESVCYLSVCASVCPTDCVSGCIACPTDPEYNTCCGSMPQGCSC